MSTIHLTSQRIIMHRGVSSAPDREAFIEWLDEPGYARSVSLSRRDWKTMSVPSGDQSATASSALPPNGEVT